MRFSPTRVRCILSAAAVMVLSAVWALAAEPASLTVDLSVHWKPRAQADFRPPAVPLVTYDPFLSIWSEADHLNDATTKHWTQHDHSLVSLIRIDGKTYRLMGAEPKNVPAFDAKVGHGPADAQHLRIRGRGRPRDHDLHAARPAGRISTSIPGR